MEMAAFAVGATRQYVLDASLYAPRGASAGLGLALDRPFAVADSSEGNARVVIAGVRDGSLASLAGIPDRTFLVALGGVACIGAKLTPQLLCEIEDEITRALHEEGLIEVTVGLPIRPSAHHTPFITEATVGLPADHHTPGQHAHIQLGRPPVWVATPEVGVKFDVGSEWREVTPMSRAIRSEWREVTPMSRAIRSEWREVTPMSRASGCRHTEYAADGHGSLSLGRGGYLGGTSAGCDYFDINETSPARSEGPAESLRSRVSSSCATATGNHGAQTPNRCQPDANMTFFL